MDLLQLLAFSKFCGNAGTSGNYNNVEVKSLLQFSHWPSQIQQDGHRLTAEQAPEREGHQKRERQNTIKHKQLFGIVPRTGGGQICLSRFIWEFQDSPVKIMLFWL